MTIDHLDSNSNPNTHISQQKQKQLSQQYFNDSLNSSQFKPSTCGISNDEVFTKTRTQPNISNEQSSLTQRKITQILVSLLEPPQQFKDSFAATLPESQAKNLLNTNAIDIDFSSELISQIDQQQLSSLTDQFSNEQTQFVLQNNFYLTEDPNDIQEEQNDFQNFKNNSKSNHRFQNMINNEDLSNSSSDLSSNKENSSFRCVKNQSDQIQITQQQKNTKHSFLDIITQLNTQMPNSNVLILKQNYNQLKDMITCIVDNWEVYNSNDMENRLAQFVKVINLQQWKFKQFYEELYPNISQLISNINQKLKIISIQKMYTKFIELHRHQIQSDTYPTEKKYKNIFENEMRRLLHLMPQKIEDLILKTFIQGQSKIFIQQKSKEILIQFKENKKLPLDQFLSRYIKNSAIQRDMKSIILKFTKKSLTFESQQKSIVEREKLQRKYKYFDQIQQEMCISTDCLGCATSFIEGFNIYLDKFYQTPIKLFRTIFKITQIEFELKNLICALLNSGGGLIMFGCQETEDKKILTFGQVITQKDKEQIQQKLFYFIQSLYPKITINNEISLSFVPITQNPYHSQHIQQRKNYSGDELSLKPDDLYYKRPFLEGKYVARIIVRPIQNWIMYSWDQQNRFIHAIMENSQLKQLNFKQMNKKRIYRFKNNYVKDSATNYQKMMSEKPFSYFDHKCSPPKSGIPIVTRQKSPILQQLDQPLQYPFMSILICRHAQINQIKQKLQEQGIKGKIITAFQNYKFKNAKYSAILHHFIDFDQVRRKIVLNQKFDNKGRSLLAINVTQYLKLQNKNQITEEYFGNIQHWLRTEFPEEELKAWQFTDKRTMKNQLYLSTKTHLSTVFLYYLLSHYDQKVKLKNPLGLDKFNEEEKKLLWKEVCFSKNQFLDQSNIQYTDMKLDRKSLFNKNIDGYTLKKQTSEVTENIEDLAEEESDSFIQHLIFKIKHQYQSQTQTVNLVQKNQGNDDISLKNDDMQTIKVKDNFQYTYCQPHNLMC